VSFFVVKWRTRTGLDDTLDVFPCHGVGGMVGMILTAVFAQENGVMTGNVRLLGVHLLALAIVVVYTFAMTISGLWVIRRFTALEVEEDEELLGLDLHQHGERAIPASLGLNRRLGARLAKGEDQ
jgi:Amt family ammonium transporter